MKDYLGNLIARHMNKAEVLQPRLASRFEPKSSVFHSEVADPETSEVDVADIFEADPVNVATVSPIAAPEIERRVESPSVQPSRLGETVFESKGAPPVISNNEIRDDAAAYQPQAMEFKTDVNIFSPETYDESTPPVESIAPTIVTIDQREKPTASRTASTQRVRSDEVSDAETRSVTPSVFPTPSAGTLPGEAPSKRNDQGAVDDDSAERTPRESGAVTQPVTPSPRAMRRKLNQKAPVQETKNETRRETAVPMQESGPSTSSVSHSSFVSHLESRRSHDSPKPQQPNFPAEVDGGSSRDLLSAVAIPAPDPKSPVAVASRETQIPPKQPESFPEKIGPTYLTRRASSLEDSPVRSGRNDPMSARMVSAADTASVETGPTINVTIGRIEVRAATQASEPRPQKQQREQQVLSLDEYLSQRSAGGR